jgi:hypothetical protein
MFGGALLIDSHVDPTASGVLFTGNWATVAGGAVVELNRNVTSLSASASFIDNTAPAFPGVMTSPGSILVNVSLLPCAAATSTVPVPVVGSTVNVSSGCPMQISVQLANSDGFPIPALPPIIGSVSVLFLADGCVSALSLAALNGTLQTATLTIEGSVGTEWGLEFESVGTEYPLQSLPVHGVVAQCGPGFQSPAGAAGTCDRCTFCDGGSFNLDGNGHCLQCPSVQARCQGPYVWSQAGNWALVLRNPDGSLGALVMESCNLGSCLDACPSAANGATYTCAKPYSVRCWTANSTVSVQGWVGTYVVTLVPLRSDA